MPDRQLLEKTYTGIASDYANSISLTNASNSWFFVKNMPSNREHLLDIGCGTGDLLMKLSGYFNKSTGIEPVPAFCILAKKRAQNSEIVEGSAEKLPFDNNKFDYIMCSNVLQHTDREKAINEAKRVLKPGGKIIITEPTLHPTQKLLNLYALFYRYFWTYPYLIMHYGLLKSYKAINYLNSVEWKKLTHIHMHRRFSVNQFIEFYSIYFPNAKFKYLSSKVEGLVWTKPNGF